MEEKELKSLIKELVTYSHETEWVELVEAKWNTLCPPRSCRDLIEAVENASEPREIGPKFYGDGHAGVRMSVCVVRKT